MLFRFFNKIETWQLLESSLGEITWKGFDIRTYEARSAITSWGENPASAKRARILVTESNGSGTSRSGDGAFAGGRPWRYSRRGAPGQLEKPTAPAS